MAIYVNIEVNINIYLILFDELKDDLFYGIVNIEVILTFDIILFDGELKLKCNCNNLCWLKYV